MSIDPARCPLCGGDNRCGMQSDPQGQGCWCRSAEFGAAIARLPATAIGKACICARCASEAERLARPLASNETPALKLNFIF